MAQNYMVFTNVRNHPTLLVNVYAESECAAEHRVLNMSRCGKRFYSVLSAQAFGPAYFGTECFRELAANANTVSWAELCTYIEQSNAEIEAADRAEEVIRFNEKRIKELQAEIEAAKEKLLSH